MNKRYNTIDRIDVKDNYSSIKNILHLGGQNVVLGPKFDIKKYLIEIEKKNEKSPKKTNKLSLLYPIISPKNRKIYNISTNTNNISTSKYNNQNYYTIDNDESINGYKSNNIYNNINNDINHSNYSSKNIHHNYQIRNNTIGINGDYNNCFLTSLGIDQNVNKNKFKTIDAREYLISFNSNSNNNRYKRLFSNNNRRTNKNIQLSKIIKGIRDKYKTKEYLDTKNDYLAYNTQNIDAVLDADKIINNYQEKNDWDLKLKENNCHKFLKNNIKIFKQNVLTKLICNEKEKVRENMILHEKSIEEKKNTIMNDEKEFENIVTEQKLNNKKIEDYRIKLEDYNKDLYSLNNLMFYKVQNKEGEIMKKLFEIEELRIYAKFVNNMLGKDISKFDKIIYPHDYEKKTDLKTLVNNAFEIYSDYLNENDSINNSGNGNEPDIIYNGFLGLEDKIRFGIKIKDEVYEETKRIQLKNKSILDEIINKKNFLEEEYNSIKEECETIKNFISKKEKNEDNILYSLAKELFIYILEIFSNENTSKYNSQNINNEVSVSNLIKISDLAEKSKNCISEKEKFINDSIRQIESFEEENLLLFEEILDSAKDRIILERQKEAKELRKIKESIKRIQAIKKLEKINFIMRRVEHPFHIKKRKKIEISPEVIKEKENKELLTYH